jgi:menaquinone-dependent protoporphyrinogen oxidase
MAKYQVVFTTNDGQTKKVAEFIAKTLQEKKVEVQLLDIKNIKGRLDTAGVKAVFLGSPINAGQYPGRFKSFIAKNLQTLSGVKVNLFSVCLSARGSSEDAKKIALGYPEKLLAETGLKPFIVKPIAGALPYTRYNFLKKFLMKKIEETTGGETDVSKDYEFTDWQEVKKFVIAGL